jgi:hypothetical protein
MLLMVQLCQNRYGLTMDYVFANGEQQSEGYGLVTAWDVRLDSSRQEETIF